MALLKRLLCHLNYDLRNVKPLVRDKFCFHLFAAVWQKILLTCASGKLINCFAWTTLHEIASQGLKDFVRFHSHVCFPVLQNLEQHRFEVVVRN